MIVTDDTSDDNSDRTTYPIPPKSQTITNQHKKISSPSNSSKVSIEEVSALPNSEVSVRDVSALSNLDDLTLTSFLKELPPQAPALDAIAKHLARIEATLKEVQILQNEILMRLESSTPSTTSALHLPEDIKLPCYDIASLNALETWILLEENKKKLITHLSFVGGNKTLVIIRRVLERLFINNLAMTCNWTGKNSKTALKDLKIIHVITDAVRSHKIAENVTDSELQEVISNWFRFTKDRSGGREARRSKQQ